MAPRIDGIDISHWNPIVGFAAIPPFHLVSLKATEGSSFVSPSYRDRLAKFRERGTEFIGHYHWIRPDHSIKSQADHFIRTVGELPVGEFLQNDWERTSKKLPDGRLEPLRWMTVAEIEEFNDRLRQHYGRDVVATYSSDWVQGFVEWRRRNPNDVLWYANYSLKDSPAGGPAEVARYRADIWQWSSTTGVPGFQYGIDVNQVENWDALERIAYRLAPEPEPAPIPLPVQEDDDMPKIIIADPVLKGSFFVDGTPVSPEVQIELLAQGWKLITQDHEWWRRSTLVKLGGAAAYQYGLLS